MAAAVPGAVLSRTLAWRPSPTSPTAEEPVLRFRDGRGL